MKKLKDSTLLLNSGIVNPMPQLHTFKSNQDDCYGTDFERFSWLGAIQEYIVEITFSTIPLTSRWGSKTYIQSEDGVVLDRVEILPKHKSLEDIYVATCIKLDKRLQRMQSSGITDNFPFV